MDQIDLLCEKYNILPSIIKDSRLNKFTFYKCYKEIGEFKNKLSSFDNKRLYRSHLSKKLEI